MLTALFVVYDVFGGQKIKVIIVAGGLLFLLSGCTTNQNAFASPLPVSAFNSPLPYRNYFAVYNKQTCLSSIDAETAGGLLLTDSRQQRSVLRCHPALVRTANERALSLASGRYFAHCDPGGTCANVYARRNGCRLPSSYAANGNNIESMIGGVGAVGYAFLLLSNSPAHARHLFGQNDFFRSQDDYGISFLVYPGSQYTFYLVFEIGDCQ
jgi:uncharacterized protein YkwD